MFNSAAPKHKEYRDLFCNYCLRKEYL